MVYSTEQFVLCLALCYTVLVFSVLLALRLPLGEETANLSFFRTFVRFALVWFCLFPIPLSVWEGLRFVIVALPGRFSYLFFLSNRRCIRISVECKIVRLLIKLIILS